MQRHKQRRSLGWQLGDAAGGRRLEPLDGKGKGSEYGSKVQIPISRMTMIFFFFQFLKTHEQEERCGRPRG
jgi:hypothetical protein